MAQIISLTTCVCACALAPNSVAVLTMSKVSAETVSTGYYDNLAYL